MADSAGSRISGSGSGSGSGSSVDTVETELMIKKLALWQTEPLSPITTHEELAPILDKLGFIKALAPMPTQTPHKMGLWQAYAYLASSRWMNKLKTDEEPPTVRMPHPNFDGLHENTYTAFLRALNFYLDLDDDTLSSIFVIRSMDMTESELQGKDWKIEQSEEKWYMYKPTMVDKAEIESMVNMFFDDDAHKVGPLNVRWRNPPGTGSSTPSTSTTLPLFPCHPRNDH